MLLIFGFLFTLCIFAAAGIFSQFLQTLINLPSVLLILVPLLFFLITSKSGGILVSYFKASLKKGHIYTRIELAALSVALKNTVKFILAAGGFYFLTFGIICLGYLGTPNRLGPNLAISLTSLTYSIAISFFIFFPAHAWAENKLSALKDDA